MGRLEVGDRRSDGVAEVQEEVQQVSVLQDAAGLKEAALKATNGGKKRLVGLYLPDGNRINIEDKTAEKKKGKDEPQSKKSSSISKKDYAGEMARRKTNLSEVGHTYNAGRELSQHKAHVERKTEEQIEDEDAAKKAKKIIANANEIDKANYGELFNFFDVDKDRTWGSIEFAQRMTDIGFPTGVEDAANLLYFAGVRDVDRITYNDFLAMMPKLKAFRRVIEKDAMKIFSEKDNGTGYISLNALRDVIDDIAGPEGADREFVEAVIKKADREKTGKVSFDFFIRALFGSPPLLPYKRDMKQASFSQKVMVTMGRFCGTAPKEPPPQIEDDEDDRA